MTSLLPNVATSAAIVLFVALPLSSPAHAQTFDDVQARIAQTDRSVESAAVTAPFRLDFGALQDGTTSIPDEAEDDWRVDVTAYLWLTSMDGDVGVGPLAPSVDASFVDILDATDSLIGFAGRLELGKGRWAGFIDGMFTKMGVQDVSGPVGVGDIDVQSKIALIDLGAMYRVCEKPASNGGGRSHAFDVYAGGRYQSIEIELDPVIAATRSGSKNWLDPIIGGRAIIQLSERFDLTLVGDIGGFGVGSDLTWALRALVGYHFTMFDTPTTLFGGYAALGTDYTDGSGPSRFEWDVVSHGPVLGLMFSF